MSETRRALLDFTYGQFKAESLGAHVLTYDGYKKVHPVQPTGGPDGTKDILFEDAIGRKGIGGCYFPVKPDSIYFSATKKKFIGDLEGAIGNGAKLFIFLTNVSLSATEETELESEGSRRSCYVKLYDLERITVILDNPRSFASRYKALAIKMTETEQASFFANYEEILLAAVANLQSKMSDTHTAVTNTQSDVKDLKAMMEKLVENYDQGKVAGTDPSKTAVIP